MSKRKRISPVEDATTHILSGKDKPCFEERFINSHKGRGVFASMSIDKGCFILEYRGKLISQEESQIRQNKYSETENTFLFDFDWDGKQWCIDASKEDGSLGRLVNDDYKSPNCKIKKIGVGGKPHLCLFSIKDIASGEEITYNYGDSKWPWRTLINRADSCSDENTPSEEAACFPTKINKKSTEQINRADSCSDENTPSEEAACCPTKINKKSTEQINRADSCSDENTPSEEAACFPTKINKKSTEQINRADSCSDENTPSEEAACFPTKINKKSTEQLHRFAARINRLREHHNRHAERFEKLSEALVIEGRVPDSSANDESEISCEESCSDYSDKDYVPDSDSSSSDSSCRSEELYNLHAKPLKGGVVGFQSTTDRSATDRSAADRSASALNNRSTSVTPMPTDLQINRYKKKQYCVYCQKPFSKIARHLEFVHHNELEVAKAFSFDKKSKERRARLHLLKSRGNFAHNAAVSKAGIGEMVACRRPQRRKIYL
ncbi:inactive histone-lysine N-methyltransferase 2E-like [Danio aesculapii]|uniref:inactive histone-lysine N-methyltransferase 2E-like n=1 Tax=Danio aesculapii TaxID=1142201 RepID=UPI0024BFF235|nr:inactive histone-lysine N-methyltransferase 2E-like [Danio aesculapii]